MSERLNVILNGKITQAYRGETILDLCRRNDIEVPTLCHDDRLDPYTSCFVCVVEVEGMKGLQPSCSTKVMEGMKIETENDRVLKSRKTALDLLVSNHYADCLGPCKQTCPAGVDVQGYISLIDKGRYHDAVALIKETNPFPAVCGRVCVRPCEAACRRNLLEEGTPVGIDYLKRFASDYDLESKDKFVPDVKSSTGKKVAVIGGGPGGMSAAFFLQKEGHQVDVLEANPYAGGWLRYGIPEYRLPNDILQKEIDNITQLGVKINYKTKFGKDISFKDLDEKYDATILAIGSQKGTLIGCEGDDAENVFSGIEFLREMELTGEKFDFSGSKVAVVGGGNTAMDCCRTSMRCGADKVYVIYRRTENEMPANPIEIHESKLEGIEYLLLTNPTKINKDKNGKVKSVTCIKMELGEPDASGRRRPIPIEGSEFELDVDYVLAAIGQKTTVDFLEDVNRNTRKGELKLNRWGDIDAKAGTLQTSVENIFACGDGVTGPATLIEAIGQARVAARSCDLYLRGKKITPFPEPFISKKDNFKEQLPEDYVGHFNKQAREEMPTLDPKKRKNFKEVELGYKDAEVASHEVQRCLECGCVEFFSCDLQKFSTEYRAEQTKLEGEYKEYEIDFRHPYVEIDNNKCILCGRCVRICKEVVGANALGLVNRGYDTFVAPSMGEKLQDTYCESCGLCISTCPTGAITENVWFKPGPVKTVAETTICNYCSIGCEIDLNHHNGFVSRVTGSKGKVNKEGNLCRYPKFGYKYLNDNSRITKPWLKEGGKFKEISFKKAFELIAEKIKAVKPDENAFFAGSRMTNEELYNIQKLARAGAGTNNVSSFHYLNRGKGYVNNSTGNVPFNQLNKASKIYLLGSEINRDNAVAGFFINKAIHKNKIPLELVTTLDKSEMEHKVDATLKIKSYYHFVKAVNYYLVANNFQNDMFLKDRCEDYETYKEALLKENFGELVEKSGVRYMDQIIEFAKHYNKEMNAVIVFSEKEVSSNTSIELFNLALITGKLGKTASGLISLKEKNNSQGLFDMGICPSIGTGGQDITAEEFVEKLKKKWDVKEISSKVNESLYDMLEKGAFKNLFILGEDPMGTTENKVQVSGWLSIADFVVVQDYFMTGTAKRADLVLPASMPIEIGGSFTNTQKVIQEFEPRLPSGLTKNSLEQITAVMKQLSLKAGHKIDEIRQEAFSLLGKSKEKAYCLTYTDNDNYFRMFQSGCDVVNARFDEEFEHALED
ncbi:MAG: FAD-dependent oxidoreductase [Bacteroidales bacterium]|nr:FAD-dependent oxidoreductase [Bacteroidales bacterium]MCF8375961.1 FAD-dependent oxidoreductase [Bacteroidales bacterium]MCF8400449.1 FAD-dependent oxidoreductase [Bacteroidales bacterium]